MRAVAAIVALVLAIGFGGSAQAAGERADGTLVAGSGSVIGTVVLD